MTAFSLRCSEVSADDSSSRVVAPLSDPVASKKPWSCARMLWSGSSQTYHIITCCTVVLQGKARNSLGKLFTGTIILNKQMVTTC